MAGFPKLKTGAVAQYPIARELRVQNQAVRFVDGSYQRYRDAAGTLRRWTIRLDLLDEGELGAVEEFFLARQGAYDAFTFTDPWDGTDYDHCRLEGDTAALVSAGEMRGGTTLTVVQERR
jgi:hypothetical protein